MIRFTDLPGSYISAVITMKVIIKKRKRMVMEDIFFQTETFTKAISKMVFLKGLARCIELMVL